MKRFNKKWMRSFLVLSLILSMTMPAAFPMQSMAAGNDGTLFSDDASQAESEVPESPETTEEDLTEKDPDAPEEKPSEEEEVPEVIPEEEEVIPEELPADKEEELPEESPTEEPETPNEEPEDEEQEPMEDQPEDDIEAPKEDLPDGEDGASEGELPEDQIPEDELATEDALILPESGDMTEKDIMVTAENYDVNQPVIESFEFAETGQTLSPDDTLHFSISAYDADSGIESIDVYIGTEESYGRGSSVSFIKDGEGNLYSGTVLCSELIGIHFYVSYIRVTDKVGNYIDWNVYDDNNQYRYKFTINNGEGDDISISNFQMQLNDADGNGKLNINDSVTYSADITCNTGSISHSNMYINTDNRSEYVSTEYDAGTSKLTGTYTISDSTYPGTWQLSWINIATDSGKQYNFYPNDLEPDADLKFTVERDDYDTEKPVIESITLDKNGQFVQAGDVITITVKASDASLSDTATAYFSPFVNNVSASMSATLTLNKDTGEYTGTITIDEDTYPCEWDLTQLDIYDASGNYTNVYEFHEDLYGTYPWYFRVRSGDSYVENMKSVNFEFYGYAKQPADNSFYDTLLTSQVIEHVGRRATLKELGVKIPVPEAIADVTFIGWEYNGRPVNEDTQLLFDNISDYTQTFQLRAVYDKGCADIYMSYITQDGTINYTTIQKFVDKKSTYKDVVDMLELPTDAKTEGFTGFRLILNDQQDENTIVGDRAWVSVTADYDSYQVNGTVKYSDKDGNLITVPLDKSYPSGTRIREVLSDIGQLEDIPGEKFEKWILLNAPGANLDDELSINMGYFDIVAVYEGKTTVETTCIYRNENGMIVNENKLILVEGEGLSDAAVTSGTGEAVKKLKHFDGLRLSEWKSDLGYAYHDRYRTIQFTAQYANCLVMLQYPDGQRVFSTVDKGAQFTLPTENDAYEDIIWFGYTKGATVTITGDMEFYVSNYKDKDGQNDIDQPDDTEDKDETDKPDDTEDKAETDKANDTDRTDDTSQSQSESNTDTAETTNNSGATDKSAEVRLSEKEISEITSQIANAGENTTVTVDMKDATVVPKQLLESIRGKAVDVVLNMNGYSWIINGMDALATDLKDINLEVKLDTDAVPTSLVKALAENKPVRQLSLTHNGDFGFRARLVLDLGKEHSGETGNLYYYDSTGKLVFVNAGQIKEDGMVSLTFSHASDYVIVIDNNKVDESETAEIKEQKRKSPKTGE